MNRDSNIDNQILNEFLDEYYKNQSNINSDAWGNQGTSKDYGSSQNSTQETEKYYSQSYHDYSSNSFINFNTKFYYFFVSYSKIAKVIGQVPNQKTAIGTVFPIIQVNHQAVGPTIQLQLIPKMESNKIKFV